MTDYTGMNNVVNTKIKYVAISFLRISQKFTDVNGLIYI